MTIRLYDTAAREKRVFEPQDPARVTMYVCGPTVYNYAHIGNARPPIVFDTLRRLLMRVYGEDAVVYARNITDIEDKIIKASQESGQPIAEITRKFADIYNADTTALNVLPPSIEPWATQHVGEMIDMIEKLVRKGYAYVGKEGVWFSVKTMSDYGKLSGRKLEDNEAGARVAVDADKRDPADFALWKFAKPGEPEDAIWNSPWGRGRPGWHIECSAMADDLLGAHFDIHGGGNDLMFPHHENELAQSCCARPGAGFANVWLHNEMLQVEGKKMSKSLGNFFTVRELLDQGYPGEVIRFVMLSTHYRKPMDWTAERAREAEGILRGWRAMVAEAEPTGPDAEIVEALADDLNVAGAMARLHALAKAIAANPQKDCFYEKGVFLASARLLGLLEDGMGDWARGVDLSGLADKLARLRAAAMETKDFAPVDALKAALIAAGVEVRMSKAGVELVPGAGFDPARLEGL